MKNLKCLRKFALKKAALKIFKIVYNNCKRKKKNIRNKLCKLKKN